MSGVQYR